MSDTKAIDWKCPDCNSVLGKLDSEGQTLRVKIRDLYIWFTGGEITITCRGCGQLVSLSQDQTLPQLRNPNTPKIE